MVENVPKHQIQPLHNKRGQRDVTRRFTDVLSPGSPSVSVQNIFTDETRKKLKEYVAKSGPYTHGMISDLVDSERCECAECHFVASTLATCSSDLLNITRLSILHDIIPKGPLGGL